MASPLKINDKDKPSEETKKAVLMRYISDSADYTSGKAVQDVPKHLMYSSRQFGYVGLENQGATCYLNSLLQMFYNIPCLRKAVNKMPTTDASSIHMALQHVFSELHFSDNIVSTRELTKALGWDVNTQQDVHEFNIRLFAELKNIDPHIGQLFEGHLIQSIHCKNVEYQSTKHCLFYDIQLDVMGCQDVYASFDKYVEVEEMDGVNQYEAGQHGFQAIAVLGTCDIALELGKKVICQRDCQTCNGWNALRCTMCKGTGRVMYQVKDYTLRSGEKATAGAIADAIAENRAEIVHLPATMDLNVPLPSKDCETCDGSGVMKCPECKDKLQVRISADDIIEPPWKAYNIMKKMDYPYEHIIDSMKDPSIAAFWLITMPQIMGGFEYDDEVKQKIWWQYKENMRYDQLRDAVAKRKPGWEYLQEGLISMDPERARNDPVVVKNIPYYKAKSALETEVMKLNPPPRPQNWGELNVPLNASSWSEEDLKDPKKLYEMTVLLNAQREIAEKILDDQWEAKWRQEKLNKMLEEKLQPYIQNMDNGVLPQPILAGPPKNDQKRNRQPKRWWLF